MSQRVSIALPPTKFHSIDIALVFSQQYAYKYLALAKRRFQKITKTEGEMYPWWRSKDMNVELDSFISPIKHFTLRPYVATKKRVHTCRNFLRQFIFLTS